MGEDDVLPGLGINFDQFQDGFYMHEGELLYFIKEEAKLTAHSPVKWGTLGRKIFDSSETRTDYFDSKGKRRDFNLSILEPVNPQKYLQGHMNTLFDFVEKYKKLNKK